MDKSRKMSLTCGSGPDYNADVGKDQWVTRSPCTLDGAMRSTKYPSSFYVSLCAYPTTKN